MNIQKAYNEWSDTYDSDKNLTRDLDQKVTREALAPLHFDSILEIGCGIGTDGAQFAKAGADYTGIDLTEAAIDLARRRFAVSGLNGEFRVSDAEKLGFPGDSFDLVYSHGVLHHTPDIEAAVSEIRRVLKPGGRALVMLYHRGSYNYRIGIRVLRRAGAGLLKSEGGIKMVHRLTGEPIDSLREHAASLRGANGNFSAAELLNRSALLSDVWGQNRARFGPVLDIATSVSRRPGLAEALVRATTLAVQPDQVVAASIRWLARHPHGRVEQLSQRIGLSRRQLQRRFAAAVGYGPKIFQSVLRFQRLLIFANGPCAPQSFADLAAVVGYADQARMTREVRRFANCTPTILLQSAECTLSMSDLFKTNHPLPR